MCSEPDTRQCLTFEQVVKRAGKWFKPDLIDPPVEYYTTALDGKVQIYSKVNTSFGGLAHNYVAEKDDEEQAQELIARLKKLMR